MPIALLSSPGHALTSETSRVAHTERRMLVAFDHVSSAAASAAPMTALIESLQKDERIVARLQFGAPRSSHLAIEVVVTGDSKEAARRRSRMMGKIIDAAIASGLPGVHIASGHAAGSGRKLKHKCLLEPAGTILPLEPPPSSKRAATTPPAGTVKLPDSGPDAIILSPSAVGTHLAGLGAALAAIEGPLSVEIQLQRLPLDARVRRQIAAARGRIAERQLADAQRLMRDQRHGAADNRLEALLQAGGCVRLEVTVGSNRVLEHCELSAISAVLFGRPHASTQCGQLSDFRALYPETEAVGSFLGIIAAAVGPVLERQSIAQIETLDGSVLGKVASGHTVRMPVATPRSHTYVIGRPGSGKSTLLMNLILQDIENGEAVVLIDPHGDLWADVRARVPKHREKDLVLVDMGDPELQPKLNILELGPGDPAEARARVVDTMYQLVRRMMFSGLTIDATGPMFNKYFRAALMLLMEGEGAEASLLRFEDVFTDREYRNELRNRDTVSATTRQQWRQILDTDGDHSLDNVTPWVTSKLTQLTQSAILRPILAAKSTSFDFGTVLASNQICLINLANGRIGTEAASLLGGLLTCRLEQAAKQQQALSLQERHQASVYFDEFHTFASEFLRPLMAETRKYGLRVTLANQTLSQMVNNDISGGIIREVLGNCANTIAFAVDAHDAAYLAPRFGGRLDVNTIVAQPNYQAVCQFQTLEKTLGPFTVKTMPPRPLVKP